MRHHPGVWQALFALARTLSTFISDSKRKVLGVHSYRRTAPIAQIEPLESYTLCSGSELTGPTAPPAIHMSLAAPTAAQRVLFEGFETSAWTTNVHPSPKALFGIAPGAHGKGLRFQLGQNQLDPILERRSVNSSAARIAGLGVSLGSRGLGKTFALEYSVRFDRNIRMEDPGMKLTWLWGTRGTSGRPDELNWYVKMDPNFDTFSLINNSPIGVGEAFPGYAALRARGLSAKLSTSPGGPQFLKGRSPKDVFTSQDVRIRLVATLNDPGKGTGSVAFYVGDVLVLRASNIRFRDRAADVFSKVDVIGMYGGSVAPQWSFGGRVDDISLFDRKPFNW